MMHRARIIGLALLALAVPQIAFGGEEPSTAPATLSVSAALDGCGLAAAAIVCQIEASWTALEGAEYYAVSVTRPDGSVVDAGQVAGTSRSVFVPYVGAGVYSVQVAAWGTPPGEDEPKVMAREKAMSTAAEGGAPEGSKASYADPAPSDEGAEPAAGEEDEGDTVTPALPDGEEAACEEEGDDPQDDDVEPADEPEADAQEAAATDEAVADEAETTPPICP